MMMMRMMMMSNNFCQFCCLLIRQIQLKQFDNLKFVV